MGIGGNGYIQELLFFITSLSVLFYFPFMHLYKLNKIININNEDTIVCYVESMFLSNKIEMIYEIVYIVEK